MKETVIQRIRNTTYKALSLLVVIAVLVSYSTWSAQAAASDALVRQQITEAERAANRGPYTTDGIFTGEAQGFGGQVVMQATIEDGWISSVEIIDASSEDDAWLDMAVVLLDRIVEEQSTNVDVISSATYTSVGILNGTTEALKQSQNGEVE